MATSRTRTDAPARTPDPGAAIAPALTRPGRLAGKVALVTGAAGNLGGEIARHYLSEGATVVFTGRTKERIDAAMAAALADTGADAEQASTVVMDGADAASCRAGIATILDKHGRIDILVNNAGSAGPKQPLERLPLSAADLAALKANGGTDTETVGDAARNILGVAWNMVRAAAPAMAEGGSIINVSTIFSAHTLLRPHRLHRAQGGAQRPVARAVSRARAARHPRQPRLSRTDRQRAHPHRVRRDGRDARRRRRHDRQPVLRPDELRAQRSRAPRAPRPSRRRATSR